MKRSSIRRLKLRTRCARCRKLGDWVCECPEGHRGTTQRRKVRSTCSEVVARHLFLEPPGPSSPLTLEKFCGGNGLQVEWSQEGPESASGIGGATQPIGVVCVPVGLAGCNGVICFTVVEQGVPPLLPVGVIKTLQASPDQGRQRRQSCLPSFWRRVINAHIEKVDTRPFVPNNLIPMVGNFWKWRKLCQNNDQGVATNYMSAIAHLHQRPRCTNDNAPARDNDAASTRGCRPRQKTSTNGNGTARPHTTTTPPSSSRFKSGKHIDCTFQNHERDLWTGHQGDQPWCDSATWNVVDGQTVETSCTSHAVLAMCGHSSTHWLGNFCC